MVNASPKPGSQPGDAARAYHNRSKWRFVTGPDGTEDFAAGTPPDTHPALGEQSPVNEPKLFKRYRDLPEVPTGARPIEPVGTATAALAADRHLPPDEVIPDLPTIGRLLQRSNGILKTSTTPWGKEVHYRAAGQTGARFHLEFYLVTGDTSELPAGVYHYDAWANALRPLRTGDFRAFVTAASGNDAAVSAAPAILIVTSQVWRNAWRYLEHAYRHVYWDMGTMLTNTLAMAASAELPAEVVFGFADGDIAGLLGIDGTDELVAALVALGRTNTPATASPPLEPIALEVEPLSDQPAIEFPVIEAIVAATALPSGPAANAWRAAIGIAPVIPPTAPPDTPPIPLRPTSTTDRTIEDVIEKRRSNRHYAAETPVSFEDLSTVLVNAAAEPTLDVPVPPSDVYLIVNNVAELEPGAYFFDRQTNALHLLKAGNFRDAAKRITLDQQYAADANVVVFGLANLDAIYPVYGDRGYRVVQFEAALFGGRLQLAAHALGLGAVGSVSPDDEVVAFFGPHAAGKEFLFVAVFGVKRKSTAAEKTQAAKFLNADRD
jgi:SagB-type dehydrogenase family enzyme